MIILAHTENLVDWSNASEPPGLHYLRLLRPIATGTQDIVNFLTDFAISTVAGSVTVSSVADIRSDGTSEAIMPV